MYFTFVQNNVGGVFDDPAEVLVVWAPTADAANYMAMRLGVDFDAYYDDEGYAWLEVTDADGTDRPQVYGVDVDKYASKYGLKKSHQNTGQPVVMVVDRTGNAQYYY